MSCKLHPGDAVCQIQTKKNQDNPLSSIATKSQEWQKDRSSMLKETERPIKLSKGMNLI